MQRAPGLLWSLTSSCLGVITLHFGLVLYRPTCFRCDTDSDTKSFIKTQLRLSTLCPTTGFSKNELDTTVVGNLSAPYDVQLIVSANYIYLVSLVNT